MTLPARTELASTPPKAEILSRGLKKQKIDLTKTPTLADYYPQTEGSEATNGQQMKTNTGTTSSGTGLVSAPDPDPGQTVPSPRLLYYYHPDYLGNVEYITDADGLPYQYFFYSPWGEALKDQKANTSATWDSPYKFNGKEQDEETGLYYYGARYYNPQVSVWLSVDAMANKYPNSSPYVFTGNNPVMMVDPDGNEIKFASPVEEALFGAYEKLVEIQVNNYDAKTARLIEKGKTRKAEKRIAKRNSNEFVQIQNEITELKNSEDVYRIRSGKNISSSSGGGNLTLGDNGEIDVNVKIEGGFSGVQRLAHELKHAHQFEIGNLDLNPCGGGGLLHDYHDEMEAYQRSNTIGFYTEGKIIQSLPNFIISRYGFKDRDNKTFRTKMGQTMTLDHRSIFIVSKATRKKMIGKVGSF